jgi:hypothetical protein
VKITKSAEWGLKRNERIGQGMTIGKKNGEGRIKKEKPEDGKD